MPIRADGAGVLAEIGKDEASIDLLIASLQAESENQPRDAIVQALGHLKSKRAMPSLALLIRDPGTDGDMRQTAIVALGMIVGRRFERQPNPETEAIGLAASTRNAVARQEGWPAPVFGNVT